MINYINPVSSLYLFSAKLAFASFVKFNFINALKRFISPYDYWRLPAFSFVCRRFHDCNKMKILDIGCPKLISLYLSLIEGHDVYATDLQDSKIFSVWDTNYLNYSDIFGNGGGAYHTEYQDARKLNYSDGSFDAVISISVIEHIPNSGDSEAIQEINRVLRPGGISIIEVPYARSSYETFVERDVYDRKYVSNSVFYERHYDDRTLQDRIIDKSCMKLKEKNIISETFPFEFYYMKIPLAFKILVMPFEGIIASSNLHPINCNYLQEEKYESKRSMASILLFEK